MITALRSLARRMLGVRRAAGGKRRTGCLGDLLYLLRQFEREKPA
jgi:hypothetical protein